MLKVNGLTAENFTSKVAESIVFDLASTTEGKTLNTSELGTANDVLKKLVDVQEEALEQGREVNTPDTYINVS